MQERKYNSGKFNRRDISLVKLNNNQYLVIACDSAGGVGPKKKDFLQVPGQVVGRFTARVPLMEVKATGANIISVVDTLAVEYDPIGREIIKGIKREVEVLGLNSAEIINGSTEENMETVQTGVGVTVTGIVDKSRLRIGVSRPGDIIIAVGQPEVGDDVLENRNNIADLSDLSTLLELDYIHEILPVGSKGIKYETEVLTSMSGLSCQFESDIKLDLEKSAGPGTALLVTAPGEYLQDLAGVINKPVTVIGEF